MADHEQLPLVGEIVAALRDAGFAPFLVGGMALVILGSLRVTRDFDFLIAHPAERLSRAIDGIFRATRAVFVVLAFDLYLTYVLGLFPWTRGASLKLSSARTAGR